MLAVSLEKREKNITVLTPADYATTSDILTFDSNQPFKIIRFPRIGWRTYWKRIDMSVRQIKADKPAYVILTGKFALWIGLFLKTRFRKLKTISILHGSEVNLPNPLWRWLTHRAIHASDEIVAVSHFTKSLLPDWILQKRHIRIIPNGILPDVLQEQNSHEVSERSLSGFPRLLTVGHVSPRKGQHRVIKALPEILKTYPDAHYHIVGRPIQENQFFELAKTLLVERHVTFHGVASSHAELASFYKAADVFMLLSENQPNGDVEGFGIVALEANLFGVPVIGAMYCGVEDAVLSEQSGYLVDGNDIKEITKAISNCVEHQEHLRQGSLDWAFRHNWEIIINQYLELLN
jgi:phosphatidylinositol alpha-1,6-mannosyltransferase